MVLLLCDKCNRRLNTAGGLSVHLSQVHKETLDSVENALGDRANPGIEIFGMEGIPEDVVQRHNQRIIEEYHTNQAERRAATGNPPPGTTEGNPAKRPKLEDTSDLKARLAAFKAKRAAGETAGQSGGSGTPTGAGQAAQSPGVSNSPAPFQHNGPPAFPPPQFPAQASPPVHFSQPYNQPMQQGPLLQQQQSSSPFPTGPPGYQQPPPMQGFGPPPQQFPPFSPPPFGVNSPPPGMFNGHAPSPPAQNGMFNRPPGLPPAPGLPSRPSFQAPTVNIEQFQQMHHGHYAGQEAPTQDPRQRPQAASPNERKDVEMADPTINDAKETESAPPAVAAATQPATPEKKAKKGKETKETKLEYENNETSPEDKMAAGHRYAFERPDETNETVLESASGPVGANVTGVAGGEDDVIDNQGD